MIVQRSNHVSLFPIFLYGLALKDVFDWLCQFYYCLTNQQIHYQNLTNMQSKKYVMNPENPVFNIRKVNKKTIAMGKSGAEGPYYTPEAETGKALDFQNYSSLFHSEVLDPRRQKEKMLDQSVNEAIVNSKAYENLRRLHIENKKKNAEHKQALEQKIMLKIKEKTDALKQHEKLEKEKDKYIEAINALKQKISALRETNERYREALSNRVSGQTEYISNLIMSMRFQAEYEHDIDPDQMTYEELLELQQKIGIVNRGLPIELINQLPRTEVTENSEDECMICLNRFSVGEMTIKIPSCMHTFHNECLEQWLGKEKVCPLCKKEVDFPTE